MSWHLFRNWRRRVDAGDTVICLGDVAHPDAWRDDRLVHDLAECPGRLPPAARLVQMGRDAAVPARRRSRTSHAARSRAALRRLEGARHTTDDGVRRAGRTGHLLTLRRAEFLRQLRRRPYGHEQARRERVVTEIEVRFGGAQEAVGRLFALAQALANDYERFEALVGGGEAVESKERER